MRTKTNRTLRKILSIALCLALVMSYVPMVSITASATAADITVNIDTGASVTLRDADGDDYYDIGTADELYAFAAEMIQAPVAHGHIEIRTAVCHLTPLLKLLPKGRETFLHDILHKIRILQIMKRIHTQRPVVISEQVFNVCLTERIWGVYCHLTYF